MLLFHIILVAQLRPDPLQAPGRRLLQKLRQQVHQSGSAVPGILGERGEGEQLLQNRFPGALTGFTGIFRGLFGDAAADFIVDAEKRLRVFPVIGKGDDVQKIRNYPMGEKGVIHLSAPEGKALPFHQVDQRQGAVVVAVQDRRPPIAMGRHVQQPCVLGRAVCRRDQVHVRPGRSGGADGFGAAVRILPDKPVGQMEDLRRGAVVFLHQQHPGLGIGLLKLHQRVRVGGPEAVDALILVSDHEKIAGFPGQQLNDGVLDLGGVLRFVHADIGEGVLKMGQNIRIIFQNGLGVDHLVVIVHPSALPQRQIVLYIQLWELVEPSVQFAEILFAKHHVLHIGDPLAKLLDHALGGELAAELPVQIGNDFCQFTFIFNHCKGASAAMCPGIKIDDFRGNAVDRADLRDLRTILAKKPDEPLLHFLGGRLGVGHGQDRGRRDPAAAEHIPQPGHQHRGFSAAGYG